MNNEKKVSLISRRDFTNRVAASVAAFAVAPRYVLGGTGTTPPSEKINLAIIGTGGQGIVNLKRMLDFPEVQVIAVCDVNKISDYSEFYFRGTAGYEPAKQIAEQHYAKGKPSGTFKGVDTYVDFRQMLEQRKDIDAVLVATCDHAHAVASVAAIKGGKPAGSNFEFASFLTEVVLLGNVALKAGKKLSWDGANMKVTNDSEANQYLHRTYRGGWSL